MSEDTTSVKALRKYCQELGITTATTGKSIDVIIAQARTCEDPRAWLAALSDAPPEENTAPPAVQEPPQIAEPPAPRTAQPPRPAARPAAKPPAKPEHWRAVAITVPVSDDEPEGYLEREMHLDVRLDRGASAAFRRVQKALNLSNARLANNRHVGNSRADVVRWLFERLATTLE